MQVSGYAAVSGIKGETFMQALGLSSNRTLLDCLILVVFYFAFVAMAFWFMALSLAAQQAGGVRGLMAQAWERVRSACGACSACVGSACCCRAARGDARRAGHVAGGRAAGAVALSGPRRAAQPLY